MRPVVLLHGFTGGPASWDAVAERLAPEIEVLRPALLGHGDPPAGLPETPPAGGDPIPHDAFDQEVDRLAMLLREHEATGWHLCGYSLGARIGLGLLVKHTELFSRATLIGVHPGLDAESARAERRAADEERCKVLRRQGVSAFVDEWERLPLFASQRRLPTDVLQRQRQLRCSHTARGLIAALQRLGLGSMPSYTSDLSAVRPIVRVLAGEHDRKFAALGRAMAERLPRATFQAVTGAGHNVVLERPEAIAELLDERTLV